jgi:hypothetical protein
MNFSASLSAHPLSLPKGLDPLGVERGDGGNDLALVVVVDGDQADRQAALTRATVRARYNEALGLEGPVGFQPGDETGRPSG